MAPQRYEHRRASFAGDTRTVDVTIRHATTTIVRGDATIVAVQESAGACLATGSVIAAEVGAPAVPR